MDLLDSAQSCSADAIGGPWYDTASAINDVFNPFTAFTAIEGPIGQGIQDLLDLTGIQTYLLDPVLELVGTVAFW